MTLVITRVADSNPLLDWVASWAGEITPSSFALHKSPFVQSCAQSRPLFCADRVSLLISCADSGGDKEQGR